MSKDLKIYSIWAWRVPYKDKFAILTDTVLPGAKHIVDCTAVKTDNDIRALQIFLEWYGLVKLTRSPDDHPALIESWI